MVDFVVDAVVDPVVEAVVEAVVERVVEAEVVGGFDVVVEYVCEIVGIDVVVTTVETAGGNDGSVEIVCEIVGGSDDGTLIGKSRPGRSVSIGGLALASVEARAKPTLTEARIPRARAKRRAFVITTPLVLASSVPAV